MRLKIAAAENFLRQLSIRIVKLPLNLMEECQCKLPQSNIPVMNLCVQDV